jgi:hypothetical protein
MRALVALATVRAWVGRDVTTPALPRPLTASGTSVYHVRVRVFSHALPLESKDTRELTKEKHTRASACQPGLFGCRGAQVSTLIYHEVYLGRIVPERTSSEVA